MHTVRWLLFKEHFWSSADMGKGGYSNLESDLKPNSATWSSEQNGTEKRSFQQEILPTMAAIVFDQFCSLLNSTLAVTFVLIISATTDPIFWYHPQMIFFLYVFNKFALSYTHGTCVVFLSSSPRTGRGEGAAASQRTATATYNLSFAMQPKSVVCLSLSLCTNGMRHRAFARTELWLDGAQ